MSAPVYLAERGLLAGRFLHSLCAAKGDLAGAIAFAEGMRSQWSNTPALYDAMAAWPSLLQKAPVTSMSTSDGLYTPQQVLGDFMPLVSANSALGRLQGVRRLPANTSIVAFASGASAVMVGEGEPVPLSKGSLATVTLLPRKLQALIAISAEVARSATSSTALANDLARAVAFASDVAAFDPNQPYSISNACSAFASTGPSIAQVDHDLALAIRTLVGATRDRSLVNASWVMDVGNATFLATLRGSGGAAAYPNVDATGGTLLGLPVLTTAAVVQSGSPQLSTVLLVDGAQIATNINADVGIDASGQASLQMTDQPSAAASNQVSMFATNSVALLATRWLAVARQSSTSCVAITGIAWV